jgi:hypothetical protein
MMKRIKIANGIKRFDETDSNGTLFRLRDILSEHRNILITRLLSDLGTYIDYKFNTKTNSRQLDAAKDSLVALKNSVLDLDKYNDIIEHCLNNEMTYVGTEPFMQEINETLSTTLNVPQLKLVS